MSGDSVLRVSSRYVEQYGRADTLLSKVSETCRRNKRAILFPASWPLGTEPILSWVEGLRGKPAGCLGLTALIHFTGSPRVTELSAQSDGPCQDMIHWSNWRIAQRQGRLQLICSCGSPPRGDFSGLYLEIEQLNCSCFVVVELVLEDIGNRATCK